MSSEANRALKNSDLISTIISFDKGADRISKEGKADEMELN